MSSTKALANTFVALSLVALVALIVILQIAPELLLNVAAITPQ